MYSVFGQCGFLDVTASVNLVTGAGLKLGDVLLKANSHTALVTVVSSNGTKKISHARKNENEQITGGTPGDQTGREIETVNYYNHPWQYVLRPAIDPEGFVDEVTPTKISGWAWNKVNDEAVQVHAYVYYNTTNYAGSNRTALLIGSANKFRADLLKAGKGNGYHGFTFSCNFYSLRGHGHYTVLVYAIGGTNPLLTNIYSVDV